MSHGQIERLAINANTAGTEKRGIVTSAENGIVTISTVDKVALKMNSTPINNEMRFHTVTPVTTQNQIVHNVPAIQHGASSGGHLIHLIPLPMGNKTIATTTPLFNSKAQQIINDIPLTIIAKGVQQNASQMSSIATIGEATDIAAVIGTKLAKKALVSDALAINSANTLKTSEVKGLKNTQNTTLLSPAGQNAILDVPGITVSNGSAIAVGQKQALNQISCSELVTTAFEAAKNEMNISTKISTKRNSPKTTSKVIGKRLLPESDLTKLHEAKNVEKNRNSIADPSGNEFHKSPESLPFIGSERLDKAVLFEETGLIKPTLGTFGSDDIVKTVSTHNKSPTEPISECFITEIPLSATHKAKELPKSHINISNFQECPIGTTEPDRSTTMLIIDDSSDEENQDEDDCEITITSGIQANSTDVTHISNSVVLTKAKTVESRNSGISRILQDEPANVVLMKIPNAIQQETGAMKSSVEIPFTDAVTIATNVDSLKQNTIKIVPTDKLLASSQKKQQPLTLMRSSSIPNASKSLSPRATKRSQSLNSGTPQKTSSGQPHMVARKNVESRETRRHSNPVKLITVYSSNASSCNEQVDEEEDSLSSLNDLDKENNKISFIELEDSFEEDFSDKSNQSANNTNREQDKSMSIVEEKFQNLPVEDKREKNLMDGPLIKDQNANTKSFSSVTISQPSSTLQNTKISSITAAKDISQKKETNDLTIKSLLCNENITAMTPSSSSSVSSTQEPSSGSARCSFTDVPSRSNTRAALAPRARDQNNIVDANPSTTRRLCRDSSIASALSMVSTFDMLNWKEDRIASARGTNMRFELNEFNLLQLHERGCPPRYRIHTPYERPIYERYSSTTKADQTDPLLYLCRKCKLYGPAVDFLAPEYCSVDCLKRTSGKRSLREVDAFDGNGMKKSRKSSSASIMSNITSVTSNGTAKPAPTFRWTSYFSNIRNAVTAPIDLFLNPFPTGPNPFEIGMKVEAIDPENCSLFCVCTIVRIQGFRLRLNFDGYSSVYDFWVNADSMDIFPPGWCEKTNRILQPPCGLDPKKFDWATYLRKTNSIGADKKFFTHLNGASVTNRNPFTVGMFLEADDLNDTGKLCVASVADVLDERIRVHFDGWDDCYDYWVDISSPYIHPCGWHEGRQQLLVPPEYSNTSFNWRDYIRDSQGIAAPTDFFVSRDPIDFRAGMKLEVVDPRNPSLIRPATIIHRTRHRVKVHLDCWPIEYIFSLEDDSPDLHPIGWCDATGHELEPPPGFHQKPKVMPCNTPGCRGLGNMNRSNGLTHATREFCPYILENWRTKPEKSPRLESKDIVRNINRRNSTSMLKNAKRLYDHSIELHQTTEKITRRGRLRKNDSLSFNSTSTAPNQQQSHQQILDIDKVQAEVYSENTEEVKFESKATNHCQSLLKSSLSFTQVSSPPITEDAAWKIAKQFLCDYGPRLQQNYKLCLQNTSLDIASKVQSNPLLWSTAETCAFIDAVLSESQSNVERIAVSSKLCTHDVDGTALLMLQQKDLVEILELKLGPAVKLCAIILQLRMLVVNKYLSNISAIETVDQKVTKVKNV